MEDPMILSLMIAAAASAPVQVGKFNPDAFPHAPKVDRRMPQGELTARADRIMASGACSLPGQTRDRYSITVPYAVLLQPSGAVSKVVVQEVGCPELELLTGQVANELSKAGDFKPTGAPGEQWYVSEVYYAHGGQDLARTEKDDDKLICEAPKRATGSNLALQRDCRTAAQWRTYRLDRDRLKRDLLSDGTNFDVNGPPKPSMGGFVKRP
jgi:hypothetical protein